MYFQNISIKAEGQYLNSRISVPPLPVPLKITTVNTFLTLAYPSKQPYSKLITGKKRLRHQICLKLTMKTTEKNCKIKSIPVNKHMVKLHKKSNRPKC